MSSTADFPFNRDWRRRNEILKLHLRTGPPYDALDFNKGYGHFSSLSVETAEHLLQEQFLDPDEKQNDSPPTHVFIAFMRRYPGVTAHGYFIGPDRDDYRVTIEGIAYHGPISAEMSEEAKRLFGSADDFDLKGDSLYVWYD